MKKIICALLACLMCVTAAISFGGCGCNKDKSNNQTSKSSGPGYVVPTTEPDLKDDTFGYYIINSKELMLTRYYGKGGKVEIPAEFQGYKISIIGHSVFNARERAQRSPRTSRFSASTLSLTARLCRALSFPQLLRRWAHTHSAQQALQKLQSPRATHSQSFPSSASSSALLLKR